MSAPRRAVLVPRGPRAGRTTDHLPRSARAMIPPAIYAQIHAETDAPLFVPTPTPRAELAVWQGRPEAPQSAVPLPPTPARRRRHVDVEWVIVGVGSLICVAVAGLAAYALVLAVIAVGNFLHTYGPAILGGLALVGLLMLCGGAKVARCAGLHCGGCRG